MAKTATPILRNLPALASFYHAYDFDFQAKNVFINVEITSTLKFPGMSTFIQNIFNGRNMNFHRLFSTEMLNKMNCPTHAQDSQTQNNPLSINQTINADPLIAFEPPSPNKTSTQIASKPLMDTLLINSNPKPAFKRNVAQTEIKNGLNWNDVFGPKQNPGPSKLTESDSKPNKSNDVVKNKTVVLLSSADLLPGENSDDYFDTSLELENSKVVVGQNKNENDPVFPIPSQLTTDSSQGAPDTACSFDMLSTSSDSKSKTQSPEGKHFLQYQKLRI